MARHPALALVSIAALALPASAGSAPVVSTQGPGGAIPSNCFEVSCKVGPPWNSTPTWPALISPVTVPHSLDRVTSVVIRGLQHTYRGDVHAYLENPAGQLFNLIVRPGSTGSIFGDGDAGSFLNDEYRLVEAGGASLAQGAANIAGGMYNQYLNHGIGMWTSGSFPIANIALGEITGSAGTWKLHVRDWYPADAGSITGWWLEGENDGATPFCFGDGSSPICPCNNNGAAGHGCGNSFFSVGASLAGLGTPSVNNDSMLFEARNLTSSICVFFQGSESTTAAVIDDGVGCVSGSLIRIGTKGVGSAMATYPHAGDTPISVKGQVSPLGGTRYYQAYYRNSVPSFCTPATSNRTNGIIVTWTP